MKARTLSQKEVDLQQEFPGHVTLVLLWIKAYGEVWLESFASLTCHKSQKIIFLQNTSPYLTDNKFKKIDVASILVIFFN